MRLHLSPREIQKGYKLIKNMARESFDKGDSQKALEYINHCTILAQQFNWIYADDELEVLLEAIGRTVIPKSIGDYHSVEGRVVFYDDFCVSFVLALQYIEALIAAGKEILYITTNEDGVFDTIIERIKELPKLQVLLLHKVNDTQIIRDLYESITAFHPEKLFLLTHLSFLPYHNCRKELNGILSTWLIKLFGLVPKRLIMYWSFANLEFLFLNKSEESTRTSNCLYHFILSLMETVSWAIPKDARQKRGSSYSLEAIFTRFSINDAGIGI